MPKLPPPPHKIIYLPAIYLSSKQNSFVLVECGYGFHSVICDFTVTIPFLRNSLA